MAARLPESWIPPDHPLDLRARVRLRHTLCDQRGEWQQRIQAVLSHHGLARRRDLLARENRAWVEQAALGQTAHGYAGLDITVHQSDQRPRPRASLASGAARAALGALRGRPGRATPRLAGPRLLHPGR